MRVWLALAVAISIWLVLEPSCAADLSFDLGSATKTIFSKLLSDVRDKVKDPKLKYGDTNVPAIAAPSNPSKYLLVDIKTPEGATITFALNKNDIYLDAYLDKFEGKYRAHFFTNTPDTAKKSLFPEAKGDKNRLDMHYANTYDAIEGKAGAKRSNFGLGVEKLKGLVNYVYGLKVDKKKGVDPKEAKLMLVLIQMFSEAGRFKYIEDMILQNFDTSIIPDPKATRMENRWGKISEGIKNSKKGVISPELDLLDAQGKAWKVSKVKDIEGDMGILKYSGKKLVALF
ncbi:antiviral protein alpha [Beta vulgaris subsp. vulgaris]|uniref:antiviral protein alpha n=1 Tax=Beta vulgaris subsp. vulgaris TaxID=3555 RepID=UPI0020372C86|nr:antiviral protein alpha [Beta vulgaris subsp. vulgaris]